MSLTTDTVGMCKRRKPQHSVLTKNSKATDIETCDDVHMSSRQRKPPLAFQVAVYRKKIMIIFINETESKAV